MSKNLPEKPKNMNMMDRFDHFMRDSFNSARSFILPETLALDVKDEGDKYEVAVDLPGINKEDVRLTLENGNLTVTVQKQGEEDKSDEEANYIHRERFFGSTSRTIYLEDVSLEGPSSATMKNGVLHITIPKEEKTSSANTIEIQ